MGSMNPRLRCRNIGIYVDIDLYIKSPTRTSPTGRPASLVVPEPFVNMNPKLAIVVTAEIE